MNAQDIPKTDWPNILRDIACDIEISEDSVRVPRRSFEQSDISMSRDGDDQDSLNIGTCIEDEDGNYHSASSTIQEFLKSSEECYSSMAAGWGHIFVDDLKLLISETEKYLAEFIEKSTNTGR